MRGGFLAQPGNARRRRAAGGGGGGPTAITYRTYAGSLANVSYNNSLGFRIIVATGKKLVLKKLGLFSVSGAVPGSGITATVSVANVSAPSTILASVNITNADTGASDAANNMLLKAITDVELPAGTYGIWSVRSGGSELVYAWDQAPAGSNPTVNAITGISQDTGDWFDGSTGLPQSGGELSRIYGGPTFEGYTIDA
jgi:hypothetical protein